MLKRILQDLIAYRSTLIIVFTPIVFSPLLFVNATEQSKCLYGVSIILIYWLTDVIPFAVTALLPLILFPTLGILTSKKVAQDYLKDSLFLFIGGFFIAITLEQANLHKRIALKALLIVGDNPKWILFALMSTTGFLSMWIINTAATAMMLPIAEAILVEMIKSKRYKEKSERNIMITNNKIDCDAEQVELKMSRLSQDELKLSKMILFAICYAANIGGIGTLTGTQANIIIVGMLENKYGGAVNIGYASWLGFGVPLVIILILFSWILLVVYFLGFRKIITCKNEESNGQVKDTIRTHYQALGGVKFSHILILIMLICLVALWIFRAPKFVHGWHVYFENGYVTDATVAILICFLLFVLPSEWPDFLCNAKRDRKKNPTICEPLVTWNAIQQKMPWGVVLLTGGSFALADAVETSGLSKSIGSFLTNFGHLSPFSMCIIVAIFVTFLTEVTNNAATATLLGPILFAVSEELHINPLYLSLTSTICVSYSFMLPIATPPNAIVYGYGLLKIIDMVKIGSIMNCISILVTIIAMNTWVWYMFDLGIYPTWAPIFNSTAQ